MVPHSAPPPPPEPRSLHPDTVAVLRAVIAERWRSTADSDAELAAAVARVAREAKADGLRPEELIVALKRIEEDVRGATGTLRATDFETRQRFREWLVTSCIRAYFGE